MSPKKPARVFAVGVNHKSGSAFLRDRLFVDEEMLPEVYGRLTRESIVQAIVLSTCDRVEIQGAHPDPERAISAIHAFFREVGGSDAVTLDHALYAHLDAAAVRHIMAVASSLDSQVIGEPQVLGQVKEAHRHAWAAGMVGHEINNIVQLAYSTAKRVRSETSIGARAVSIASAAVQIAKDIHGDLRDRNILIVGLGEIGDLIIRQLKAAGAHRISLAGPGRRTEREALSLGFHFLPFDDLLGGLVRADIIVSTLGLGRFLIERGMVDKALRERRRRPMLFLDGGLPADVEPDVHDLDGAFVYTLDDLEQVAQRGRQERAAVATEAWEIVDCEVERWRAGRNIEAVVPTLVALRKRFDLVREEILVSQPEIDAHEATRLLVNRLLHAPTRVLRDLAEQGAGKDIGEMLVRRLFALDKDDGMEGER